MKSRQGQPKLLRKSGRKHPRTRIGPRVFVFFLLAALAMGALALLLDLRLG